MNTTNLTRFLGTTWIKTRRHLPEILTYTGLAEMAAGTVWIGSRSTKLPLVVQDIYAEIEAAKASGDPKRLKKAKKNGAKRLAALYAAPGGLWILGGTSTLAGMKVLRTEAVGLAATVAALTQENKQLKLNVANSLDIQDEDLKKKIVDGLSIGEVSTEENEVKVKPDSSSRYSESVYARDFDERNRYFRINNPYDNLTWLKQQERFANDKLDSKGYLFLNEVYEMLGFQPTKYGAQVGWIVPSKKDPGNSDGYVSFGLNRYIRDDDYSNGGEFQWPNTDFLRECIPLDFNVDGPILYCLPEK